MARQRKRRGRLVNGIVLLDKPAGLSSNHALQRVKRLFDAAKAGHTGSLDVPATGLLPVCLGEATKVSGFLLDADKTYLATGYLGVTTTTGDASGDVLEERTVTDINEERLLATLDKFKGPIEQVPPMFSALKHNGERLYKLAYQGIEVERKPRPIEIYELSLQAYSTREFTIRVRCSKGTYIRSLVQDIGAELGCGAHTTLLRRLQSGPFYEEQMLGLEQLQELAEDGMENLDKCLLSMDQALAHLPGIFLTKEQARHLCLGQAVQADGLPDTGLVRIYEQEGPFLGIGEARDDGLVAPKRLINIE